VMQRTQNGRANDEAVSERTVVRAVRAHGKAAITGAPAARPRHRHARLSGPGTAIAFPMGALK
jgi:hypothetical protein